MLTRLTALAATAVAAGSVLTPAAVATTFAPMTAPALHGESTHHMWGGYAAKTQNTSSVSARWVVPTVDCSQGGMDIAPWVGIDGYGNKTVEQTGMVISCQRGGRPSMQGWYEMYPDAPVYYNEQISAGDQMAASVTHDGGNKYTLTLTNETKGWSKKTPKTGTGENATAEAVTETHGTYPKFGKLTFTDIKVDGKNFENYNPDSIITVDDNQKREISNSKLSNGSYTITDIAH